MPLRRKRQRQQQNKIDVRLNPGDDDLAEWWASLPYGTGSETVKKAIRAYISSTTDAQPASSFEVRQQMDELKRAVALVGTAVARVDDRIKAGVVMVGVPVENAPDELSNEEERQRLNNVLKAKW